MKRLSVFPLIWILFLVMPAFSAQLAEPVLIVRSGNVQALNLNMLSNLQATQRVFVQIDQSAYTYKVAYRHVDKLVVEVSLTLVSDPSKHATFGINGDEVTAFIQTPQQTYALGYSNKRPVIGLASTMWTTPALGSLPAINSIRTSNPSEKPPVEGATPINLNTDGLSSLSNGESASLMLPGLGGVRVIADSYIQGFESASWSGHLADFGSSHTVTLTWTADGASGYITTPQGEFNISKTKESGVYIWNPTSLGIKRGAFCASPGQAAQPANPATAAAPIVANIQPSVSLSSASLAGKNIDLLVYYSSGMLTKYGSVSAMTAVVDNAIALMNQAFSVAPVEYRIRRVGLKLVNVVENSDNAIVINQMAARLPPFDALDADRKALGADMVTVMRPFDTSHVSCGLGYLNAPLSWYSYYGNWMLSVVSEGISANNFYCNDITLAHELGHNLGLAHDRRNAAGAGVMPYAYGYNDRGAVCTIMAYSDPFQSYTVKYSNPLDNTCGSQHNLPCGIASDSPNSANNAAALRLTLPIAITFVAETVTGNATVGGSFTYNGVPVLGQIRLVTGDISQIRCAIGKGTWSCTVPPNRLVGLSLGFMSANKSVSCSPPSVSGYPVAGARYTINVACR